MDWALVERFPTVSLVGLASGGGSREIICQDPCLLCLVGVEESYTHTPRITWADQSQSAENSQAEYPPRAG
jgi:hypothetical protein